MASPNMQFGQISPSSTFGPRGGSLVLAGLGPESRAVEATRPRVTKAETRHHSDVVHTAYLHIGGKNADSSGRMQPIVCMASGAAMAYCALARTWLCLPPRMGGLDHGAQGACSAQAKKE